MTITDYLESRMQAKTASVQTTQATPLAYIGEDEEGRIPSGNECSMPSFFAEHGNQISIRERLLILAPHTVVVEHSNQRVVDLQVSRLRKKQSGNARPSPLSTTGRKYGGVLAFTVIFK